VTPTATRFVPATARQLSLGVKGRRFSIQANRAIIEWVVLVSALSALMFLLLPKLNSVQPSDGEARSSSINFFNNAILDTSNRLLAKPLHPKLILIDIDETSLGQLGRWPWKREIHGKLIDLLAKTNNRVLLDVLFPEPSESDDSLARAIRNHGNVFLPIAPQQSTPGSFAPIYPVQVIGKAAKGLGHAQFSLDSDGVVRGLFLSEGGFSAISEFLANQATDNQQARDAAVASATWPQKDYVVIPAISGLIPRVSYAQVLRGDIDPAVFEDKIVLIGATARGLGDSYANALVNRGALSPGVELHALATSALLNKATIKSLKPSIHQALSFGIFFAVMVTLYRLRPRPAIIATTLFLLSIALATLIALYNGIWLAPGVLIIITVLAYPLWSWRRLEASFSRLSERAKQLSGSPVRLPNMPESSLPFEPIARSLQALHEAADYALALRDFLRQVIDEIPYPVWVGDTSDRPLLSNLAAQQFFPLPEGQNQPLASWLMQHFGELTLEDGKEYFWNDHSWLLRLQSFEPNTESSTSQKLWLYQLIDVTTLRQTQRERDQMMRFLSHDMRSPQVSILSILQQQTQHDQNQPWIKNIKIQTERTLELADGVVQLARAESVALRSDPILVEGILAESSDSCWAAANAKGIRIHQSPMNDDLAVQGDPHLIRRALVNLIDNAIKFSTPNSLVTIDAEQGDGLVHICVADNGIGIAEAQLENVFKPYWRADENIHGVGLGLTFVNLVATRHGGAMHVAKNTPQGCRFVMSLPIALS
jgi:signal transduction histidine kinase/CHASE2 domain-containing sensor protein